MPRPEAPEAGETQLLPYWERVSRAYAADDPLAAVCYPGAPAWLNRFLAGLQWRAVRSAVGPRSLAGKQALDIGCGSGRWTRWLADRGARALGIDPTVGMLEAARRNSPEGVEYRRMSATSLDLADGEFDIVTCITVIQHLQPSEQEEAVAELARVLRPGGEAVVLDLIDTNDRGEVVFPRPPVDWMRLYERHGLVVTRWTGQEFVPLIRGFRWLAERVGSRLGVGAAGQRESESLLEKTRGRRAFRAAYAGLWALVQLSRPIEPPCRWLLPRRWARHACFVLRKPVGGPAK